MQCQIDKELFFHGNASQDLNAGVAMFVLLSALYFHDCMLFLSGWFPNADCPQSQQVEPPATTLNCTPSCIFGVPCNERTSKASGEQSGRIEVKVG